MNTDETAKPLAMPIMRGKRLDNKLAVAAGVINKAVTNNTPTLCAPATIVNVNRMSKPVRKLLTGMPILRAWVGSKELRVSSL